MSWLSRLTEGQIQKILLSGGLSKLEGEGKPLPDRPGDALVDPGEAVGFRIMAQAGVLPEEIELKKKIDAQRAHLAGLTDAGARKAAMVEFARLELRHAIATEARRRFMKG